MTLEAEGEEAEATPAVAAEAFASLVEDTVAKVAQLDEEDLADEALVEEAAYTAFHESSAANFPPTVLSPEAEFHESGRAGGTWVPMPRDGPRRYRKYSHVFNVVIHPAAAQAIRTFSGRPLSAFIRDRFGRTGPVRARIHLYQATPGSTLGGIARAERSVAGLGTADRLARSRLHPLDADGRGGTGRRAGPGSGGFGGVRRLRSARDRPAPLLPRGARRRFDARRHGIRRAAPGRWQRRRCATRGRCRHQRVRRRDTDAAGGEGQPATAASAGPTPTGAATSPRSSDATASVDVAGGTATVTIYVERGRRPVDRGTASQARTDRCKPRRSAPDLWPGNRQRSGCAAGRTSAVPGRRRGGGRGPVRRRGGGVRPRPILRRRTWFAADSCRAVRCSAHAVRSALRRPLASCAASWLAARVRLAPAPAPVPAAAARPLDRPRARARAATEPGRLHPGRRRCRRRRDDRAPPAPAIASGRRRPRGPDESGAGGPGPVQVEIKPGPPSG